MGDSKGSPSSKSFSTVTFSPSKSAKKGWGAVVTY